MVALRLFFFASLLGAASGRSDILTTDSEHDVEDLSHFWPRYLAQSYTQVDLTVKNGHGSGTYAPGSAVSIVAECSSREDFKKWEIVNGKLDIDDSRSSSTEVTIRQSNAVVKARCRMKGKHNLIVKGGSGDGKYRSGQVVSINANKSGKNKEFLSWKISKGNTTIEDFNSSNTTLVMPAEDVTVEVVYTPSIYTLVVEGGEGSGDYPHGEEVPLLADECAEGTIFDKWIVVKGDPMIKKKKAGVTTITIEGDATVKASCEAILYDFVVVNGKGDGEFSEGTSVKVTASKAPKKEEFHKWIIVSGDVDIIDSTLPETTVTIGGGDSVIQATYKPIQYELSVINGSGGGAYSVGETVTIVGTDSDPDSKFIRWTIISGNPDLNDINSPTTNLEMPAEDVTIEAVFNLCGISDEKRSKYLLALFKGVSGNAPFKDSLSPQSRAADWLINEDGLFRCPGEGDKKTIQRYVLAIFYFSTEGDGWRECSRSDALCGTYLVGEEDDFEGQKPYLSDFNECEWAGSSCDIDKCIIGMDFEEQNGLGGTLPEELGDLEGLQLLSLENQNITGSIPATLSKAKNLRRIDFDFNLLTGEIPEEIYTLSDLEQLDLNNNKLTGTLSNSIGNLKKLIFIQLHFNEFTGTFPRGLEDTGLLVAQFQNNNFRGLMPLCISDENDQVIGALSADCGEESGSPVICGRGCGCECY